MRDDRRKNRKLRYEEEKKNIETKNKEEERRKERGRDEVME